MLRLFLLAAASYMLISSQLVASTADSYLLHENYDLDTGAKITFTSLQLDATRTDGVKYNLHKLRSSLRSSEIDRGELQMTSLPTNIDQFTFSSVYITTVNNEGKAKAGTGFVVSRAHEKFLVTCQHCVQPPDSSTADKIGQFVFNLSPCTRTPFYNIDAGIHIEVHGQAFQTKERFILEIHLPLNFQDCYHSPKYDLTLLKIDEILKSGEDACNNHYSTSDRDVSLCLKTFEVDQVFTPSVGISLTYLTDVFMFGYPYSYRAATLPFVRKGCCASNPNTSIFYLDIATAHGSSGSAVFFHEEVSPRPSNAAPTECKKYIFAGMLYAGKDDLAHVISAREIGIFFDSLYPKTIPLAEAMNRPTYKRIIVENHEWEIVADLEGKRAEIDELIVRDEYFHESTSEERRAAIIELIQDTNGKRK